MKKLNSRVKLFSFDLFRTFFYKTTIFLFLFSIGFNSSISAQLPTLDWAKQFNLTSNFGSQTCSTNSLKIDAAGNIVTTGFFGGYVDFNPDTNLSDTFILKSTANSSSGYSLFISKLDSLGNYLWVKNIGSSSALSPISAVTTSASGSIYAAGGFADTGHFGNITLLAHPYPGHVPPTYDGFVSKQNAHGDFIWVRQIGGRNADNATSIAVDPLTGDLIVAGTFYDTVQINTVNGPVTLASNNVNSEAVFVCRLDTAGNFLWAKQLEGDSGSVFQPSLCLDAQANIYLVGNFYGTVDFDPGLGTLDITRSNTFAAMFVCKLNSQGESIWVKATGDLGRGLFTDPPSITVDREGNVYTTGNYGYDKIDFDPGPDTAFLYPSIGQLADIFVCKWSTTGNFVWVKGFNRTASDTIPPTFGFGNSGTALSVDQSGNVFTSGYFYGKVDFNPGTNPNDTFVLHTAPHVDGFNGYVAKLNAQGNFVWAFQLGGSNPSGSSATTINVDQTGTIFCSGMDYGTINFDPNGSYLLTGTGAYILKLKDTNNNNNGILPLEKSNGAFHLYPNPASSEVWLKNDNQTPMKLVTVCNVLGQVVFRQKINQSLYTINIRDWASGLYFVKVDLENGKTAQVKFEIRR